jgi:hypothetical protein
MKNFFSNLFAGGGARKAAPESYEQDVVVTSLSQPNVLREKMREKKLTHGEVVTVNISPVRLEGAWRNKTLYFCPMKNLDIIATIKSGDGQDIPAEVMVEGLKVPKDLKPGLYALKNVRLTSNGTMQVLSTTETTWELVSSAMEF